MTIEPSRTAQTSVAIGAQIEYERVSSIYRLAPMPQIGAVAFSMVISYAMWGLVSAAWVIGWLAFRVGIGVTRSLETRRSHAIRTVPGAWLTGAPDSRHSLFWTTWMGRDFFVVSLPRRSPSVWVRCSLPACRASRQSVCSCWSAAFVPQSSISWSCCCRSWGRCLERSLRRLGGGMQPVHLRRGAGPGKLAQQ